jgi:RNA polymerase sigma factor (sigma-70 family)
LLLSRRQELRIVHDCKLGDRSAQHQLYESYSRAMYNICLRMLGNSFDAEDVLQNSFVDVFTKIDSFRSESTLGAWIKRIVINNCINHLKRKRIYFEEISERHDEAADNPGMDTLDDRSLDVRRIKRAMAELPDGYRVVFSLYLLEGYDHKEIAEILNISESTSKSQYSRAKSKIREIIQNEQLEIHD